MYYVILLCYSFPPNHINICLNHITQYMLKVKNNKQNYYKIINIINLVIDWVVENSILNYDWY